MIETIAIVALMALAFIAGWRCALRFSGEFVEFEPHGLHEHACECGNTWQRDDKLLPIGALADAHACSKCGTTVLEISRHLEPESA